MKKLFILFVLASSLFSEIRTVSVKEFSNVKKRNQLVIVDFFANWCGPCRNFLPLLDSVAQKYPGVFFCKINIDKKDGKKLKSNLGIKTIPTLVFYKKGVEVYRVVGRLPEDDLVSLINTYKN